MTQSLPTEVRACIDGHLDAIERVLVAAGLAREQRRNITDNVETQILDMLASRTQGRAATGEDIAAILAQLDPPAAYAQAAGATAVPVVPAVTPAVPSRFSRAAIFGGVWIALGVAAALFVIFGMFVVDMPVSSPSRPATARVAPAESATMPGAIYSEPKPSFMAHAIQFPLIIIAILAAIFGISSPFGGTILGWVAVSQIYASRGRLHGLPLALFDGLFYPLLLVNGLVFFGAVPVAGALFGAEPWAGALPLSLLACLGVSGLIIFLVVYYVRRHPPVSVSTSGTLKGG